VDEGGPFKFLIILIISLVLLVLIVYVDQGQRRIPVTFARRVVGRKELGGNSTYIPLKVNQSALSRLFSPRRALYSDPHVHVVPWASFQNFVNNSLHHELLLHRGGLRAHLRLHFFYVYIAFEPTNRPSNYASRAASYRYSPGHATESTSPRP